MPQHRRIRVTVNGQSFERDVEPRRHLADFLRHDLDLTGTHVGCEHGVCGACTVLLNGAAVRSCLIFAIQAHTATIETVESLSNPDGSLHPLQEAFRDRHALQCGFCTSGMLMTLVAFFKDHPQAHDAEIRDAISGNICRCTGYQTIVEAALQAAPLVRGGH